MKLSWSRRDFLKGTLAASAGAFLLGGVPRLVKAQEAESLTFFTYSVYSSEDLMKPFEEKTGIKIIPANYSTQDEMLTKLEATKGEGFDIVSIANNYIRRANKAGGTAPIEVDRIPNWSAVYPHFSDANFLKNPEGELLGVPTVWGPEGLIYRTDKIETVDSWAILWDEKYKGKIGILDHAYEMVLVAAQYLGITEPLLKDPIVFTDEQLKQIEDALLRQKPLVKTYWQANADAQNLMARGEIWISIGRILMQTELSNDGIPVRLVGPKEGAQGWCTSTCRVAASQKVDAIYEFLNYAVGDTYGYLLATTIGYPSASRLVMDRLSEEERNKLFLNDPNILKSMVWWNDAADYEKWVDLWNRVKAA